jgi:hypothetical protein
MFCAPGACLGLGCRLRLFAAVSAESDLNTLAPSPEGLDLRESRPEISGARSTLSEFDSIALASGRLRVKAPVRQSAVPLALCPPPATRHTHP